MNPEPPESQRAASRALAAMIRRPVTALMLLILIAVLGAVSYSRIPLMLSPQGVTRPMLSIDISFPDSSPFETADKVARPVEEELRTLPNVKEISSESDSNGASVRVQFDGDADMDLAYADVKDRLERVRPSFPDGVDEFRIRKRSPSMLPIFYFGVNFDETIEDPFGRVEDVIQPRLEAVDGVAQVQVWGMVQDAVRIFVKPERLRSHGLDFYDLVARLRRDNFSLPAGVVEDGEREFLLRVDTSFKSLDELREYPIAENVRLMDVADVVIARSYRDYVSRVNGKRSMFGMITKESDENTVAVCERVRAQFAELEHDPRLKGFGFKSYFDQSEMIVASVDNLKSSAGYGGLFAVIILYFFVRRLSTTLLVALAIPVSLLAAVIAIYFCGMSFNVISLAGFTLAVGMLVDNSIVVAENIDRRRRAGDGPQQAAETGAGQVGIAILLSTLTTIIVFAPIVFMAGDQDTRVFLRELALPITFSLLASLLTALVFLPIATVFFARRRERRSAMDTPGGALSLGEGRLVRGYRALLAAALRHRFGTAAALCGLVALSAAAGSKVEPSVERNEGGARVQVSVELPRSFTLQDASDAFAKIEAAVMPKKEEYRFEDFGAFFRRNGGDLTLWLQKGVPQSHVKDLSRRLKDELPKLPGVRYRIGFEGNEGEGSIRLQLVGKDPLTLAGLGEDVVRELSKLPELSNVRTSIAEGVDEMRVQLDRDQIQRFGVTQESLQGLIAWGVGGQALRSFTGGTREIPVRVELEGDDANELDILRTLEVPVSGGAAIPLSALSSFHVQRSLGSIARRDGETSLTVTAETLDRNSYRVSRKVNEAMANVPLPEGYSWTDRGRRVDFEAGFGEILKALVIGIVFVFLLMGMLFESAVLPLAVLLAIPPAMTGAGLGLFISGVPFDETAMLALVLLAGVVVNNGIVLVDRIRQLCLAGVDRTEAILAGCAQRLRPVLMTALTTMFGLLPMALPGVFGGSGQSMLNYQSLAIATLGGLALSTLLTLVVVPLFYALFDDLGALLRRAAGFRAPAPLEAAA